LAKFIAARYATLAARFPAQGTQTRRGLRPRLEHQEGKKRAPGVGSDAPSCNLNRHHSITVVTVTLSAGRVSAIGFFSALAVAIRAEEGFKAKTATVAGGGLCASG